MWVYKYTYINSGTQRCDKCLVTEKLELQVVMSCLMCVLENKLCSSVPLQVHRIPNIQDPERKSQWHILVKILNKKEHRHLKGENLIKITVTVSLEMLKDRRI